MSSRGLLIYRIILAAVIASLMVTIFCLSAQSAEKSSQLSGSVTERICEIVVPGFKTKSRSDQVNIIAQYNRIIRKYGHFTEYLALGFFAALQLTNHRRLFAMKSGLILSFITAALMAFMYSITDEIHQLFVPGRAFQIYDIAVDTIGATIGSGIAVTAAALTRRIRGRH